ncbi:MAG: LPD29 domain-containing protein [bacterium]|nr:LPD29 domain-containing protein [bacterium]
MPYITTERVKQIREELKKEFPSKKGWKLSVTRRHYSGVDVRVLSAPIKMTDKTEGGESVNYFYIADHYKDKPEVRDVLLKIYGIMNEGNRTASVDGDYGNIPEFYVSLSIGQWDKPFVFVGV